MDALNQELFQLWMGVKETTYWTGVFICQGISKSWPVTFPEHFPPDYMDELKCDCFYGRLPKWLKAMVAYLKASLQGDDVLYLQAVREAKKEDSMERTLPKPNHQ